jgi:hypothetical protein
VSDTGSVIPDSIFITGGDDDDYMVRLRQTVEGYAYWPAVLDGCAVSFRAFTRIGPVTRR